MYLLYELNAENTNPDQVQDKNATHYLPFLHFVLKQLRGLY